MTLNERLNAVLFVLLNNEKQKLENKAINKKVTFDFICRNCTDISEAWEVAFLKDMLLNDGYMELNKYGRGDPPHITHNGIKFIQMGGYKQQQNDIDKERLIKTGTINSFKNSRYSLIISLLALIISTIFPFYNLYTSNILTKPEQLNKLESRIEELYKDHLQTKKTLDSVLLYHSTVAPIAMP